MCITENINLFFRNRGNKTPTSSPIQVEEKFFQKYPSQNAFPIPYIVEGHKRNSIVKVHKHEHPDLYKTEDSCKYSMKRLLKTPLPVPL